MCNEAIKCSEANLYSQEPDNAEFVIASVVAACRTITYMEALARIALSWHEGTPEDYGWSFSKKIDGENDTLINGQWTKMAKRKSESICH